MADLAWTARMFGARPSAMLGVTDQVLALAVDLAAARVLVEEGRESSTSVNDVYL